MTVDSTQPDLQVKQLFVSLDKEALGFCVCLQCRRGFTAEEDKCFVFRTWHRHHGDVLNTKLVDGRFHSQFQWPVHLFLPMHVKWSHKMFELEYRQFTTNRVPTRVFVQIHKTKKKLRCGFFHRLDVSLRTCCKIFTWKQTWQNKKKPTVSTFGRNREETTVPRNKLDCGSQIYGAEKGAD